MMHPHRNGERNRLALILLMIVITFGISWASMQCKMVVMDVHMKRCSLGAAGRTKRTTERLDLEKDDRKSSERQEAPDYSRELKDSTYSHGAPPQKRQPTPERIGNIALPIATEAVNGATRIGTYTVLEAGYYDPGPSVVERTYDRSGYYPSSPYPLARSITPLLAFSEDFDLGLNNDELEELYNDIYERSPRASKEEAWKVFLETASQCCQNIDRCKKEMTHISCLAV